MEKKFNHYFTDKESRKEEEFFKFTEKFGEFSFSFNSCSSVFSKNSCDEGSLVLINTIIKNKEEYNGKILDMGCGYGTISIILSRFLKNSTFNLCDINGTAVELSKKNAFENKCKNIEDIFVSDMFSNVVGKYNHIISNPPIKTGKKLLFGFISSSKEYLEKDGSITVVIKKNLGQESLKKHMEKVFGNCEILKRDRGYYVLRSKVNSEGERF